MDLPISQEAIRVVEMGGGLNENLRLRNLCDGIELKAALLSMKHEPDTTVAAKCGAGIAADNR